MLGRGIVRMPAELLLELAKGATVVPGAIPAGAEFVCAWYDDRRREFCLTIRDESLGDLPPDAPPAALPSLRLAPKRKEKR